MYTKLISRKNIILLGLVVAICLSSIGNYPLDENWKNDDYSGQNALYPIKPAIAPISEIGMTIRCDFYDSDSLNYTQHLRPEYYSLSAITYRYLLSFTTGLDIAFVCVYTPLHFSYRAIDPYCSYSVTNYNHNFTVTAYQRYTIEFHAGTGTGQDYVRQNQFLGISQEWEYGFEDAKTQTEELDYTSTAFTNTYGFFDFYSSADNSPDTTINTTIVSDGAFSLKVDSHLYSGTYRSYMKLHMPKGEWYLSFDHYLESGSSIDNLLVQYCASGFAWTTALTLSQTTNRWHKNFVFVNPVSTEYGEIRFYFNDGADFVLFLDNIHLYQANAVCITTDYQKAEISGSVISWDGLDDPYVDTNTTIELRYRSNSTLVLTKNLMTVNGAFAYEFSTVTHPLSQCEYSISVTCWDSWFSSGFYNYDRATDYSNTGEWYNSGVNSITESFSSSVATNTMYSFLLQANTTATDNFISFNPTGTWDFSYIDYLSFKCKFNSSFAGSSNPDVFLVLSPSGNRFYNNIFTVTTSFTRYDVSIADYSSYLTSLSLSAVDYLRWDMDRNANLKISFYIDEIKCITSQKSYFTPQYADEVEFFAHNWKWGTDGIDWQEGAIEYTSISDIDYHVEETGMLHFQPTAGSYYSQITWGGATTNDLRIDADVYNIFRFRIKTNASRYADIQIYISERFGAALCPDYDSYQAPFFSSTNWQYFEVDARLYSAEWTGQQRQFTLNIVIDQEYAVETYYGNESFWIDYMFLTSCISNFADANTYFQFTSTNSSLCYLINNAYYSDNEFIWKNSTSGTHNWNYYIYNNNYYPFYYLVSVNSVTYSVYNATTTIINYLEMIVAHLNTNLSSISSMGFKTEYNVTATPSEALIGAGQFLNIAVTCANTTHNIPGAGVIYRVIGDGNVLFVSALSFTNSSGQAQLSFYTAQLLQYLSQNTTLTIEVVAFDDYGAGSTSFTIDLYFPVAHNTTPITHDPIRQAINATWGSQMFMMIVVIVVVPLGIYYLVKKF